MTIDGLGEVVAGVGPIEVGQKVGGALWQGASQGDQLGQLGRDAGADRGDHGLHQFTGLPVGGVAVGGNQAPVDAPVDLDLYVPVAGEECLQAVLLVVGK